MTGAYQMGKANAWRNPYLLIRSYLHGREDLFEETLVVYESSPCVSSISIWRGGFCIRPIEFGAFLLGVKTQTEGCAANFRFCLSPSLDLASDFTDPPKTAQRGPRQLSNASKHKNKAKFLSRPVPFGSITLNGILSIYRMREDDPRSTRIL